METKIEPGDMFNLKKGMKIRLKDGTEIILTSDYIADGLKYEYDGKDTISCLKLVGCMIIE